MADNLVNGLDQWINNIEKKTVLPHGAKAKITEAGANEFAEVLRKHTPRSNEIYNRGRSAGHANAKHGNSRRKTIHLQDSITYKAGQTIDKKNTGDTDVSFGDDYFNFLAKIINNGKHRMSDKEYGNMHFVDKARAESSETIHKVMADKYREMMDHSDS